MSTNQKGPRRAILLDFKLGLSYSGIERIIVSILSRWGCPRSSKFTVSKHYAISATWSLPSTLPFNSIISERYCETWIFILGILKTSASVKGSRSSLECMAVSMTVLISVFSRDLYKNIYELFSRRLTLIIKLSYPVYLTTKICSLCSFSIGSKQGTFCPWKCMILPGILNKGYLSWIFLKSAP